MSECPSCGRFTGPYEACPYCGARLSGRTPLRVLKVAAVVLAIAGLAALWFAALRVEVPRVQIGQVAGMMNMAYVRIEGRVSQGPDYDPEGEFMAFWVADDSGELRVSAYRNETRELIAQGRIPSTGDQVSVAGTLRIREDYVALYLNAPEQIEIDRPEPVARQIGQITPIDVGLRVRVYGQVREVYEPYAGLTLISLRDDTGEVAVAVSEDLELLTGDLPEIRPGQGLEVVATVTLYRDTPQLVPASTEDLLLTGGPAVVAERYEIGALTTSEVGQWIQVEGEVVESDPFSAGIRFLLEDGSGQITLLIWQALYEEIPYASVLDVGARVRVQGNLTEYKGALEVVPEVSQDVEILVAAPEPEQVRVADLGLADVGRVVLLEGVVGEAEPFSQGVRYLLDDGSGQIVLLLWSNVAGEAPAGLGPGAEVRVIGEVAEYRGEMEIVPRRGSDLTVVGRQALPTPTPPQITPIGQVDTGDQGRTLTVEGELGERETFSAGVRFPLRDDSGEIVLLLWQDVYDAFPEAGRLAAGVQVRIAGQIQVYEGTLEIVPEAEGVVIQE